MNKNATLNISSYTTVIMKGLVCSAQSCCPITASTHYIVGNVVLLEICLTFIVITIMPAKRTPVADFKIISEIISISIIQTRIVQSLHDMQLLTL